MKTFLWKPYRTFLLKEENNAMIYWLEDLRTCHLNEELEGFI